MIKRVIELLRTTFEDWSHHEASLLAAAMAYYLLVTLAPLLMVGLWLIGLAVGGLDTTGVADTAGGVADAAAGMGEIADIVQRYSEGIGGYGPLIAMGIALVGSSVFVGQLTKALDTIWDSEPEEGGVRYFVRRRLLGMAALLVAVVLLLVAGAVYSLLDRVVAAAEAAVESQIELPGVLQGALNVAPFVAFAMLTLLFSLAFTYLPSARILWRTTLPGAALTAVLYLIGQWALQLYLSESTLVSAYGAVGSFVAFVVWIFYTTQVILFGAEFTRVWVDLGGWKWLVQSGSASSGEA